MKRMFLLWPALVVAVLASPAPQAATPSAEVALRVAMETETVKGDLKGAIDQYRKIADAPDRAVAVRALVRMAKCYDMLGDAKSAAEARTRLTALDAGAAAQKDVSYRRVATLAGFEDSLTYTAGDVSPDGRYLPLMDWRADRQGDLVLHDLQKGTDRLLAKYVRGEDLSYAVFSGNGKQLAYSWQGQTKQHWELRIVDIRGSGELTTSRILKGDGYLWPHDWSDDGKWIAVTTTRSNLSTIGLLSIQDGSVRAIKSLNRDLHAAAFSPDGRYLAYEVPREQYSFPHDILILAVDGSVEIPAVVDRSGGKLIGWSPDGTRLLFTRTTAGNSSLWARSWVAGTVQGPPELVRLDLGSFYSLGVSPSGALYSILNGNPADQTDIKVASFDFANGQVLSPPVYVKDYSPGSVRFPDWTPDGKSLAYASVFSGKSQLVIRNLETDTVREFGQFNTISEVRVAPDGASVTITGSAEGGTGMWIVNTQTGVVSKINDRPAFLVDWSPDGKKIYFKKSPTNTPPTSFLMERDVATGNEREVLRLVGEAPYPGFCCFSPDRRRVFYDLPQRIGNPAGTIIVARELESGTEKELGRGGRLSAIGLSPDGRYLAAGYPDSSTKTAAVVLIPVDGSPVRELMRREGVRLVPVAWSPDSRSMLVTLNKSPDSSPEYWWVPMSGGESPKLVNLAAAGESIGGIRVDPSGRRLAFPVTLRSAAKPDEVWVLERFLPPAAKKK